MYKAIISLCESNFKFAIMLKKEKSAKPYENYLDI